MISNGILCQTCSTNPFVLTEAAMPGAIEVVCARNTVPRNSRNGVISRIVIATPIPIQEDVAHVIKRSNREQ